MYGGPGGRAMRRCLSANVDVTVDDVDVTIDDDDVTVDDDDVTFTRDGLKLHPELRVPATPILEYSWGSWPCTRVLTSRCRETR